MYVELRDGIRVWYKGWHVFRVPFSCVVFGGREFKRVLAYVKGYGFSLLFTDGKDFYQLGYNEFKKVEEDVEVIDLDEFREAVVSLVKARKLYFEALGGEVEDVEVNGVRFKVEYYDDGDFVVRLRDWEGFSSVPEEVIGKVLSAYGEVMKYAYGKVRGVVRIVKEKYPSVMFEYIDGV